MTKIQFLIAVHFYFLLLFLPPQLSALFPTWLKTVPHIFPKKKAKLGGRYNRLTRGYCSRKLPNGKRCLHRSLWFCNGCHGFNNKKVYYCRHVHRNCFGMHHDSLVRLPWHVCFLYRSLQWWLPRLAACCYDAHVSCLMERDAYTESFGFATDVMVSTIKGVLLSTCSS